MACWHALDITWPKQVPLNGECHNLSLGLTTKAMAYKGEGQKGSPKITSHALRNVEECEGMNPTLPNELPLWERES